MTFLNFTNCTLRPSNRLRVLSKHARFSYFAIIILKSLKVLMKDTEMLSNARYTSMLARYDISSYLNFPAHYFILQLDRYFKC